MKRQLIIALTIALSVGCASFQKNCAKFNAGSFGSDWIVVQFAQDGRPFHCWKLHNVALSSTEGGNVDWQDSTNGHLVHLTGWENRIQVVRGDFDGAAKLIGVESDKCDNGPYPAVR